MDPDETARMRRLIWIHAGRNRLKSESAIKATSREELPGNKNVETSLGGSGMVFTQDSRYQSVTGRKVTFSAKADGLTYIKQTTPSNTEEGNIHSGALPPWLQPEDDSSHSSVIGPTIQDFQKHLDREKKSKLPANRVGANFDHAASTSHDWLPSFGRVWSKGRRLQSKQHFERELKKGTNFGKVKQKPTSTVSSYSHSLVDTSASNQSQPSVTVLSFQAPRNEEDSVYRVQSDNTESTIPIVCNPYKRKRDISKDTVSANQRSSFSKVSTECVPYKRRRDQMNIHSVDQVKLLHTPVLAQDERK